MTGKTRDFSFGVRFSGCNATSNRPLSLGSCFFAPKEKHHKRVRARPTWGFCVVIVGDAQRVS